MARQRRRYRQYDPMTRTEEQRFRSYHAWTRKSLEIRERDNYCCQACIRNLKGTRRRVEYENVGVHHAVPLREDFGRRLDNDNLITLCTMHHEMAERGEIAKSDILSIIREQEKKISPPH